MPDDGPTAHDAPHRDEQESEENILVGSGFVLVNEGDRIVRHTLNMTLDERREVLRPMVEAIPQAEAEIEAEVDALRDILAQRNPLSVVGSLWLWNAITDGETYAEHLHEGNDAFTEYVATLALTQAFDRGEGNGLAPHLPSEMAAIQERVKDLFRSVVNLHGAKSIDLGADEPQSRFAWLRFKALLTGTATRYAAYPIHLERMLRGVLMPIDDVLLDVLGFMGTDALALCAAVEAVTERKLNEHLQRVVAARDELLAGVEAYIKDGTVTPPHDEDFYREGAALPLEERQRKAMFWLLPWAYTFIGDALVFTADELAAQSGVALGRAEAFAERMSLGFGDVEPRFFSQPSATPPLHVRPLIRLTPGEHVVPRHAGNAHFCPVPQSVFWALRANVESGLNPEAPRELRALRAAGATEATWERYERSRSVYAEQRAMDLLSSLLPGAVVERNLMYEAEDQAGGLQETELDGLLLYDETLLVVEVKAGVLSPPARRGASDSLQEELRDRLIGEGHYQAVRAKRFFEAGGRFRRADGAEVALSTGDVREVVLLVVTLEDLEAFTTNLPESAEAGLLASTAGPDESPWCVSLADLEVVADLLNSPTEFLHFLKHRVQVAGDSAAKANDELDWLGHYLREGTGFEHATGGDPDAGVQLMGYTAAIDDYYMYTSGGRQTPAEKPAQPLPSPLREIRDEIERNAPRGRPSIASVIYDLPHEHRETIAERMRENRRVAETEGRDAGASFPIPDKGIGLTHLMLGPGTADQEGIPQVGRMVVLRKYTTRSDRWLGIGTRAGAAEWASVVVLNTEPWAPNPALDALQQDD